MKIFFKPSFIKDFKNLPLETKKEVKEICLKIFPNLKNLQDLESYQIKSLKDFKNYYRIKLEIIE